MAPVSHRCWKVNLELQETIKSTYQASLHGSRNQQKQALIHHTKGMKVASHFAKFWVKNYVHLMVLRNPAQQLSFFFPKHYCLNGRFEIPDKPQRGISCMMQLANRKQARYTKKGRTLVHIVIAFLAGRKKHRQTNMPWKLSSLTALAVCCSAPWSNPVGRY